MRTNVRLLVLLFALAVAIPALAQFTGSVQGTVTDPSGQLVPSASVTLRNTETNVTYKTSSNSAGQYRFLSLPPGTYSLTVEAPGFHSAEVSTRVSTEETAGINVSLKVGSTSETVTVTAQAAELNPEETRSQYTLDVREIADLPIQNRATLEFVRLAPGVSGVVEGENNLTENRHLPTATANGRDEQANLYTLDSVPITSSQNFASAYNGNEGGGVIFVPNTDSLGEVALQTTTFATSYGTAASMVVAFNTKSGANQWHGDADYSYTGKPLNAFGFNQNRSGADHRHVYSFGVGGALIKDRTFFWGSYQGRANLSPDSSDGFYFTPQFTQWISNPANDPNQIDVQHLIVDIPASRAVFKPGTGQNASSYFGDTTNCTKAGTGQISGFYNTPCDMQVTQEASGAIEHFLNGKQYSVRVDQYFNGNKDRLFGYYFSMDQNSDSESVRPSSDGYTPTNGKHFSTNYTHLFSPNLLNTATFGYTAFHFDFTSTPHSRQLVDIPFLFLNVGIDGFTRFVPFSDKEYQYYGRDSLLWTHGKHSFDIGFEAAHNIENDDRGGIYARPLFYLWFSKADFFNDRLDMENLTNYYDGVTGKYRPSIQAGQSTREGIYFQDQWKVKPNLTVTYGLRWDDLGNPSPYGKTLPFGNYTNLRPSSNVAATQASVQNIIVKPTGNLYSGRRNNNFLPRIGVAWAPFKRDYSTVFRGGVGLYQDIPNLQNAVEQATGMPPGILSELFFFFTNPAAILSFGNSQTAPYGYNVPAIAPPTYRADGSPTNNAPNIPGVDPNLKMPRSLLWNFSVEHQLPANLVAALTYTGSHSYRLIYRPDLNRPEGSAPYAVPPATSAPQNFLNPHWGGISPWLNGAKANYNGMTAALRQNWKGIQWQASYTWQHSLDDPTGYSGSKNIIINQYDIHAQYASAEYDVRHHFTFSGLVPIPVPFSAGLGKAVLGGWNLNNVVIAQSGLPFTFYYGNSSAGQPAATSTDFNQDGLGNDIPDYIGPHSFTRKQFGKGLPLTLANNFPNPTGYVGNEGRNQFRNVGYFTWDSSVQKKIALPLWGDRKGTLALRVEGFNILNRANLEPIQYSPNGTSTGDQLDGGFGFQVQSAYQARTLQVGARLEF